MVPYFGVVNISVVTRKIGRDFIGKYWKKMPIKSCFTLKTMGHVTGEPLCCYSIAHVQFSLQAYSLLKFLSGNGIEDPQCRSIE